jgi:glyoxylase-like metal-dependent hydrolase (beta-lactamase superfamily II)
MLAGLNIDIFNTGYRPVPSAIPVWPDDRQATWPATTSTLISGERDGVLVDALVTKGESQELADWLATTGKNLTEVYITHAHGDHFFGLNTVLDKFPNRQSLHLVAGRLYTVVRGPSPPLPRFPSVQPAHNEEECH